MCGKFTAMMTWREYCALAGCGTDGGSGGGDPIDPETMLGTFTPMGPAPVLHLGPVRQRRLALMRWGWIDHKRGDPRKGFSHLHARAETIDSTPTWIDAFHESRGVVFGKTFNIGEELPNGKVKQWVCSRADDKPVALAVLYDIRELPIVGVMKTYVMVTTEACPPLNMRDTRMPAILQTPDEIADWLGETGASSRELKALLRPYDGPLNMREQDPAKPPKPPKEPKPTKPKKAPPPEQDGLF